MHCRSADESCILPWGRGPPRLQPPIASSATVCSLPTSISALVTSGNDGAEGPHASRLPTSEDGVSTPSVFVVSRTPIALDTHRSGKMRALYQHLCALCLLGTWMPPVTLLGRRPPVPPATPAGWSRLAFLHPRLPDHSSRSHAFSGSSTGLVTRATPRARHCRQHNVRCTQPRVRTQLMQLTLMCVQRRRPLLGTPCADPAAGPAGSGSGRSGAPRMHRGRRLLGAYMGATAATPHGAGTSAVGSGHLPPRSQLGALDGGAMMAEPLYNFGSAGSAGWHVWLVASAEQLRVPITG